MEGKDIFVNPVCSVTKLSLRLKELMSKDTIPHIGPETSMDAATLHSTSGKNKSFVRHCWK